MASICFRLDSTASLSRVRVVFLGSSCYHALFLAILELTDVLLTLVLEPYINQAFPPLAGFFTGAVKHTQTLEITSIPEMAIER